MNDLSLTILPETVKDAQAIERLHERTFGPGRFVLSAYRLREHVDHLRELSFTARIGTLLVGSVRQLPILIGDGIQFFEKLDRDIPLHLMEVKAYKSGTVELRYEVRGHRGEPRDAVT